MCIKWIRWRSRHSIMHKSLQWPWWTRDAWHWKTFANGFRSTSPTFVAIKIGMWVLGQCRRCVFSCIFKSFLWLCSRRIPFATICHCIFVSRKSLATKPRRAKVATGSCRWIRPKVRRSVSAIDGNNAMTRDVFRITIDIHAIISNSSSTVEMAKLNIRMRVYVHRAIRNPHKIVRVFRPPRRIIRMFRRCRTTTQNSSIKRIWWPPNNYNSN